MTERSDVTTGELHAPAADLLRASHELLTSIGTRLGGAEVSVTVERDDED